MRDHTITSIIPSFQVNISSNPPPPHKILVYISRSIAIKYSSITCFVTVPHTWYSNYSSNITQNV